MALPFNLLERAMKWDSLKVPIRSPRTESNPCRGSLFFGLREIKTTHKGGESMAKKILLVVICIIGLIIFVSTLYGQGPKKTITLPNGEVICDLNGEWDVLVENIGKWADFGNYPQIWKITQTGISFSATRMMEEFWNKKGSEAVQGELDKSGIKKIRVFSSTAMSGTDATGQISDDGNKITVNSDRVRLTATRK